MMRGPFLIIFTDLFGFSHKYVVNANNANEATGILEREYKYPIARIDEVFLDYYSIIHDDDIKFGEVF